MVTTATQAPSTRPAPRSVPRVRTILDATRHPRLVASPLPARVRVCATELHGATHVTVDVYAAGAGLAGTLDAPDEATARAWADRLLPPGCRAIPTPAAPGARGA